MVLPAIKSILTEFYCMFFLALKNQSGLGRPSEIYRDQILTSFLQLGDTLQIYSGSQLSKNSYVRIQVGKRLNNNRRHQMAINDFVISSFNVHDDMIVSIDIYKSSDKIHVLIKLSDTHPTCPCCSVNTKT